MSDKSAIARTVSRRSIERRIQKLREEMIQWQNDLDHWNRLHPDERIVFPTDIATEIEQRMKSALESA